ncbi:hypothetical protein M430DRAFT_181779 [Amorphotheca resinae ATCC 22711]|uniref:Uncharacterized protein n=1 Tax=Amorphotheca resinae ATCC 22711 TaxID=857342 RepID=A0A2T3ARK6_AMORE|nr:hypothetical protein M430DRAFT_181779 [Amorphotheca resinae ATCC 22711]PSS08997.1 hypothetical protein M430DRAFT_181779 [Amorphotheca resinae ATCC 22711]
MRSSRRHIVIPYARGALERQIARILLTQSHSMSSDASRMTKVCCYNSSFLGFALLFYTTVPNG